VATSAGPSSVSATTVTAASGSGPPASAQGAVRDTTAATGTPASTSPRIHATSLPNRSPSGRSTSVATSRSGRSGPASSAGTADIRTGNTRSVPASTWRRSPQPGMSVRASVNAPGSRPGSAAGNHPVSNRRSPCRRASAVSSGVSVRGDPVPSARAIRMPGRTRSASAFTA
jgi:hypothetical protein